MNDHLQELSNRMFSLTIERDSGFIKDEKMPWEINPQLQNEFNHCYHSRLKKMKGRFNHLENIIPIGDIAKVQGKVVIIKGILKRLQHSRIRVFQKNYSERYDTNTLLYQSQDQLQLQDQSGKIRLSLHQRCVMQKKLITNTDLPFGIIVGVKGKYEFTPNKFFVEEVYCAEPAPQRQMKYKEERNILIISEATENQLQKVAEMLNSYQLQQSKAIFPLGLIICGFNETTPQSFRRMDVLLGGLKETVDVLIMPSIASKYKNNYQSRNYPIQPYNKVFFKHSASKITLCNDPQLFCVNQNMKVAVFSGEITRQFTRNCSLANNSLSAAMYIVQMGHYCPTAPFSLRTQSFLHDPFVIEELPHILIITDADLFGVQRMEIGDKLVLIICIPARNCVSVNYQGAQILLV